MNKSKCERCRGLGFWETDDQNTYFFKVMIGDFRRRMTIPYKFAQNFRDKIQGTIKLKACNGSTCSVLVAKSSKKLVLTAGWAAFANSHDLKMGDFLVFRYIGNSQFKVKIFDPSGCVKASSLNAVKFGRHVQTMQGDPIETSSSSDNHLIEMDGTDKCSKKMKTEKPASSPEDDQETPASSSVVFSPSTKLLTEVDRMKVEKIKARAAHSKYPVFVAAMTKPTLVESLVIWNYASKYLPREHQMVTLRRGGKSWQVWFRVNKHDLRMLSRGWKKFAGDNGLQVGDACLFELLSVDENSYTMNVHIIRK